jgi:predicted SAM-dependent methyltransferase
VVPPETPVIARGLVLAADTLIRARNGRLLVHTTASALPAFETDQPMLAGWICRFSVPTDPESAIAALPEAGRASARGVIEYLRKSGVLVPAGGQESGERPPAQAADLCRNHLRLLARSTYDLACDVMGLGPENAERDLAVRTGIGLERRLMAVLASLDALRSELLVLRRARVAEQLAAQGLRPDAADLRLHIGCGKGRLPGWIDIDVDPAPLSINVLWGLPFRDGSVRRVFVSHLLEHLFYPRDMRLFLDELRRVMTPGGIVRIVVPDIEQCIAAYVADDRSFHAGRRETWDWWPKDATRLQDLLAYAGAGPEPAHLFEAHKYGYDFETLARVLGEAGFEGVRRSAYMASEDPELRVDEVSEVAKARYGERYYSLFVEACAPEA